MNAEVQFNPQGAVEAQAVAGISFTPEARRLADNNIVGLAPPSNELRPFTMIRAALLDHARATGTRVFAVTSADPGNGKTHVTANLAMAMARIHPTVLVELDLRRPALGERLGLPGDYAGVEDYLAGECPWSATRACIEGLDLTVHRVRRPRLDAEVLLAGDALPLALHNLQATQSGTICLIDTPPAILSDDLALIARNVDGILVVAEEGRTAKAALQDIAHTVSPTPIIGTVLNRSISQTARRIDYGYYQSGYQPA
ncbi:CpsD/CapB family tyrosine-protein kinase [Novosphingobium guangzhouense]|uniref:ATPase n=1 Tax=Novosphingobium guangzhouense TaxID=1850347 RepID=A0A2K2FZX0_9SPHN|nr:CpsD/CapB family tyrosine-protein kinase [Novosphingobium guangzhouense]PNU04336.1 ATPase [Novosphingobium guangzhouense]